MAPLLESVRKIVDSYVDLLTGVMDWLVALALRPRRMATKRQDVIGKLSAHFPTAFSAGGSGKGIQWVG